MIPLSSSKISYFTDNILAKRNYFIRLSNNFETKISLFPGYNYNFSAKGV
jgi:hypothetical protein